MTNIQQIKSEFCHREILANITDLAHHLFGDHDQAYADYTDFNNDGHYICPECGSIVDEDTHVCENCLAEFDCVWGLDYDYVDPMEYYIVSPFLGKHLLNQGEMVLARPHGWIWGRKCSGQAVWMDTVISNICEELGLIQKEES